MPRVPREFYEAPAPLVARRVLGKVLVRVVGDARMAGIIVETEAYRGTGDPASHAFRGRTPRSSVMFGEPGHAYVYFSYGSHYCLNLTAEPSGSPAAVLVRAIEPVEGVSIMRRNRRVEEMKNLASGPGKLTEALAIDGDLNGEDLVTSARLFLEDGPPPSAVLSSPRVGVSSGAGRRWRFFVARSTFVSGRRTAQNP